MKAVDAGDSVRYILYDTATIALANQGRERRKRERVRLRDESEGSRRA